MPEIPDLEVVRDFLNDRLPGRTVERAEVLRPAIIRSHAAADFSQDIVGRTFGEVTRYGKDLFFALNPDRLLAINLMLTGRLQWTKSPSKRAKRTYFFLGTGEHDLRYIDERQMGLVYYVRPDELHERVPRLTGLGPDALDGGLPLDEFTARLRLFSGEIKGILTRGRFVAGIGNAYVDEILFDARVSPFTKRRELSDDDVRRIYESIPKVLLEAREVVRERMLPNIDAKVRDFLRVHRKGGEPCPVCGATISEITANQRITSYCRHCQPGSLLRGVREHAASRAS